MRLAGILQSSWPIAAAIDMIPEAIWRVFVSYGDTFEGEIEQLALVFISCPPLVRIKLYTDLLLLITSLSSSGRFITF